MKNFIVGSGWKMVKSYRDSVETAKELEKKLKGFHSFPVVIFPSFTALAEIGKNLDESSALKIGGQDLFWEEKGAYTGEISGAMLLELGCRYVEINHQERRKYLLETNSMANRKLKTALRLGLIPFLCVGEEENGPMCETESFLEKQLRELLEDIEEEQARKIVFAYEPMWAIGKKDSIRLEHIQAVHAYLRSILGRRYGEKDAADALIIYGGGITMDTYSAIADLPDVNGLFTTGCGVNADTYSELIWNSANRLERSVTE